MGWGKGILDKSRYDGVPFVSKRRLILISVASLAVTIVGYGQACSKLPFGRSPGETKETLCPGGNNNGGGYAGHNQCHNGGGYAGDHFVAEIANGKFDLKSAVNEPAQCLVANSNTEFWNDVQTLMSGAKLQSGGSSYSCVTDAIAEPAECYEAQSWSEFRSLLMQLMSVGTVVVNNQNYSCIGGDNLQPLPCYVVPAGTSYSDYLSLIMQFMSQGATITVDGQTYTCIDGSQVQPPACYQATSQAEFNQLNMELMSSPSHTVTVNGQTYTCVNAPL